MPACCCPRGDEPRRTRSDLPPWRRRVGSVVKWGFPALTLALVPKCPACVAGYVLLFTGVGISLPAAAAVRWALIALCVGVLAWSMFRSARRILGPLAR